jgi:hypothetical protein
VWYRHKLGQSWSAKYRMVHSLKVCDDEVDVIDMEVVGGAELDCPRDLTQGLRGLPREHSLERCIIRLKVFRLNVSLI